jgi:uncharacterized membrane protein
MSRWLLVLFAVACAQVVPESLVRFLDDACGWQGAPSVASKKFQFGSDWAFLNNGLNLVGVNVTSYADSQGTLGPTFAKGFTLANATDVSFAFLLDDVSNATAAPLTFNVSQVDNSTVTVTVTQEGSTAVVALTRKSCPMLPTTTTATAAPAPATTTKTVTAAATTTTTAKPTSLTASTAVTSSASANASVTANSTAVDMDMDGEGRSVAIGIGVGIGGVAFMLLFCNFIGFLVWRAKRPRAASQTEMKKAPGNP